jgi:hypothetical protein
LHRNALEGLAGGGVAAARPFLHIKSASSPLATCGNSSVFDSAQNIDAP